MSYRFPAIFVNASWHLPNSPHTALEEFLETEVAGKAVKEHELGLKHMTPDPEVFTWFCGRFPDSGSCTVFSYVSVIPATNIFRYTLERSRISRTSILVL